MTTCQSWNNSVSGKLYFFTDFSQAFKLWYYLFLPNIFLKIRHNVKKYKADWKSLIFQITKIWKIKAENIISLDISRVWVFEFLPNREFHPGKNIFFAKKCEIKLKLCHLYLTYAQGKTTVNVTAFDIQIKISSVDDIVLSLPTFSLLLNMSLTLKIDTFILKILLFNCLFVFVVFTLY